MQVCKVAPTTSSIHTFHDTSRSCARPSLLLLCPSRLSWLSWLSWLSDSLLLQLLLQLLLSLLWLWPPASCRPDMADESVRRMEEHSHGTKQVNE
jgi:hypothetical protein